MNKREFLKRLRKKLSVLPKRDAGERLSFYSEMIDDRMEEGLSEEEAISEIGSVDEVVSQIIAENHLAKCGGEKAELKRKLTAWEITLIVLGFPVWFPLAVAAGAVIISVYAVIWSVIAVIWAVEIPFFILSFISKYLFIFCKKATECTALFTKYSVSGVSKLFTGGENR